jgi:hypothetical protein
MEALLWAPSTAFYHKNINRLEVIMGCPCCVVTNANIVVGNVDIAEKVITVSVDTTQEVVWEPSSNTDCEQLPNEYVYLFGPSKTVIQLTAYPFEKPDDYLMGFSCPVSVNVSIPWKYVYDCRTCVDCIGQNGSKYKRRGSWRGIPMRKRQIAITGDITGSDIFEPSGCPVPAVKYTLQAGPQPVVIPQQTMQYSRLLYKGLPIQFDTEQLATPFTLTVEGGALCPSIPKFETVQAYMTSFTCNIQPPQPPTVQYSFDLMTGFCLPDC